MLLTLSLLSIGMVVSNSGDTTLAPPNTAIIDSSLVKQNSPPQLFSPGESAADATQQQDMERLELLRDRAISMQKSGFGFLIVGIGAASCGIALIISGVSHLNSDKYYYGYLVEEADNSNEETMIMIGYLTGVLVATPLITVGIIRNRIGNHRRIRATQKIQEARDQVYLDIGLNSLKFSYRF